MNTPIKTLLPWGPATEVQTRNGPRNVRKAALGPGHGFWKIWASNKEALKLAGVSISKYSGVWEACWWLPLQRGAEQAELETALANKPAVLTPEQEERLQSIVGKLLEYQIPSVRRIVKSITMFSGTIDASDTGTGKTYCAIAACYVLGRPLYVVCPKAVRPSWHKAAKHFGVAEIEVCNYELIRRGEQHACRHIIDEKTEHFEWTLPKETVIIFDECHRMKDYSTLNCKLGMSAVEQGYNVIALSATCADNPLQMKFAAAVAKLYNPQDKYAFLNWAKRHGVQRSRWGGLEFDGAQAMLNEIHRSIFPLHGTRVRIADLGDAFPETQITAECYDTNGMADKIALAYETMNEEIARIEAKEDSDKQACILVAMLRTRQRAEILKVPAIAEMARDAVESRMSVAIFVNFDDSAEALMNQLETTCCIRGGQSDIERESCIEKFQADKEPVIVCNIRAGGVGISLHGTPAARTRLAIICPTWSGQDLKQALGRVHRAQGAKSIQRIFFAAGTIEERICQQVQEKIQRIETLNDGDLTLGPRHAEELKAETEPDHRPTEIDMKEDTGDAPKKDDDLSRIAAKLTPELVSLIHVGMKLLAGNDRDRARESNGVGFSAHDGDFGHKLAEATQLSPRMAAAGAKLCRKYRGQLGDGWKAVYEIITVNPKPEAPLPLTIQSEFNQLTAERKGQAGAPIDKATLESLRT